MSNVKKLPQHWQIKKLGEVCEIIMGQSPPSTTYNSKGIGLPFFQGKAEFTDLYPIVKKWCNAPSKVALPNDILLSVRAPVGTTNIAYQKCCIGRGLAAIRYESYKYVFYFLRSIEQQLDKKGTGTTFRAISGEIIRTTNIPLPPLPEQQAIVSKIEELLSDLENGKQQLQTAQQQLKIYRQSLLKWAFEGKLTNKNVNGELPNGWKLVTVKDISLKILGGGTPSTKIEKYWNGDIPWISSADIYGIKDIKPRRKITNDAIKNSAANLLSKGGIIVVTRVGLGKLAVAPFDLCFSQDSQGLILNKNQITTKYALWVLHQQVQIFKHQSRGTTINGVTKKQLADLAFPLPPIEEQNQIVNELESKLTVCDKIEEIISQSLQQTETLRQSILKKAFEGRLI
jgi:type I restriction enzyme, S subunit